MPPPSTNHFIPTLNATVSNRINAIEAFRIIDMLQPAV